MSSSTFDRVTKVIVQATGVSPDEPLRNDTPLVGSGISLDSVAVVELLVGLEKEFHVEISADELLQTQAFKTVGTLVQFIDSKLRVAE